MPFNKDDYKKSPWINGCMTLTNDEVIKVQDKCAELAENFTPDPYNAAVNDNWLITHYNESNNYEEAVNGDTYNVIKSYNRDVNTQGIGQDEQGNGIVFPEPEQPEEPTEEPNEEAPVEEEQPVEQPTEEEVPTEEV